MSYPPPPPSGQWPGPTSPPPSGPPSGPPPGWGPPPGDAFPPGPPPGQPPRGPRRNVGLIVGLAALAVVLVCAIGVTAFLLMTGDDGDERAGDDTTSSTSGSTGSPSASDTASPTPTDPGSSATPSTPPTPYTPSDDGGDDVHADVKAADFPGDWDFKLGDVEHSATLDDSWDYTTCGPVEEGSTLTQQRCEYAVQWTYTAMNGRAKVTHLFLVFDNEQHAKAVEADLEDKDFDLSEGSLFPDFVQGKWNKSVYGNVVGVTIGTTNTKVPEKRLQSLVNYMNTDYRLALSFQQGF